MWLLRTMRVLKREGYRWTAAMHIAATKELALGL
jgi:hypothetical protein